MTEIAGYRILRSLGTGRGCEVLLGYRADTQVALKVRGADDPAGMREAIALERAAGEHVVRLLDLHADDERHVLVLERLEPIGLDQLLDRRSTLEAGEVVTIAAPIALALDRMHRAGVAHTAITMRSVRFRADGAPVLVGFGGAASFQEGAPEVVREAHDGVRADRAALVAITAQLLARCAGPRGRAAGALATAIASGAPPAPERLAAQLFEVAAARPVRFDPDEESSTARVIEPIPPPPDAAVEVAPDASGLLALVPVELRSRMQPLVDAASAWWERRSPRTRRLGLGIAAGALTLAALGALLPAGDGAPTTVPAELETAPAAPPSTPDEPIAAAGHLLERRAECLEQASVLCIDGVTQSGSGASAADRALLDEVAAGAELPLGMAPGEPVLVERLGDSALVDLPPGSEPSSVLLFRTAEGWRIRDYLE